IPDRWPYESLLPRGAVPPMASTPSLGYTIFDKAEVWADSAGHLYEEGIQRRWVPALDVDWTSLQELPSEVEHAMCQICTDLGEQALTKARVLGRWLPEISYGYHESKVFLGQEIFDLDRIFEALRKRSLANGGGLGVQAGGLFVKAIFDSPEWVVVNFLTHVLGASFAITEFAMLEAAAPHAAEKKLFRYVMQDLGRHARYGGESMRLLLHKQPHRKGEVTAYIGLGEAQMAAEIRANKALREAYIILFGHKAGSLAKGKAMLDHMRRLQVESYLRRLDWIGLKNWDTTGLNPALREFIEPAAALA
ncbi:MAG TPA: hypothetical protein VNL92_01905, partial [Dehalococcoidia bacterium]|nr:hypothetical protein [Dehalococcoidia bacterium]